MSTNTTTRDKIIDEAMHLFSRHGYAGTSVSKIEKAAGLSAGAGGLYHHFKSKEEVLAAGIERHLARLDALRDIRRVLTPLGDLKAELTLIARYVLAELDSESELLRILAIESGSRPELLTAAADRLLSSTLDGFAAWIGDHAGERDIGASSSAIATLGLSSLLGNRVLSNLFGVASPVDDEELVEAWVGMVMCALGATT